MPDLTDPHAELRSKAERVAAAMFPREPSKQPGAVVLLLAFADEATAMLRRQLEANGERYNDLESASNFQVHELDELRANLKKREDRDASNR